MRLQETLFRVLLTVAFLALPSSVSAQKPTTAAASSPESVASSPLLPLPASVPTLPTLPDGKPTLTDKQVELLVQGGLLVLAAVFGTAAEVLRRNGTKLREQLAALRRPAKVNPNETSNSVMLLGVGGSGKTALIGALTNSDRPDPRKETGTYEIFSVALDSPATQPNQRCVLFLSDYVGQNLGSLISSFLEQQKISYSPMRYGYIRSVIFVVDLIPPPKLPDIGTARNASIDLSRVHVQLDAWNEQAVSAVFGMLTRTLNYVCLFINKVDAVEGEPATVEAAALKAYEPLRRLLGQFSRGALVQTIVGSATTGAGLNALRNELIKASRPPEQ